MFWTIVRWEVLRSLSSFRFALATVIVVGLMGAGSGLYVQKYRYQVEEYRQGRADNKESLKAKSSQLKNLLYHQQTLLVRPSSLGFVADGGESDLPNSIGMSILSLGDLENTTRSRYTPVALKGIDWVFIVQVVLSFVVVVLSFDAISGERENGTLRLVMSHPVPRAVFLSAKYVASMIVIVIPFLIGCLVSLLITGFSPTIRLSSSDGVKILCTMLASILYLSAFVWLSILVSARTQRSETSLAILLLIWTVFVVVVPGCGGALLNLDGLSIPSPEEIAEEAEGAARAVWTGYRAEDLYVTDSAKDASTRRNAEVSREAAIAAKKVRDHYRKRKLEVVEFVRRIVRIFPSSSYEYSAEAIAGVGIDHVREFLKQAEKYRQVFESFFQEEDAKDEDSGHLYYHIDFLSKKPVDVDKIPQFEERPGGVWDGIVAAVWSIFVVFVWNILFFIGGYLSFLRCDIG